MSARRPADDDQLGGMVGVGDRALVGLVAHAEVAGIDAHDLARGGLREVGAGVAQVVVGGRVTVTEAVCVGRRPYNPFIHGKKAPGRHIGSARGTRPSLRPVGRRPAIGGLTFWRGEIAGREAVFVESGAGKVNAGVATALLLDRFDCRALMLCGVAGGLDPDLGVGDIVVGTSNIQHDYGMENDEGFVHIQPGSRPSLGEEWTRAIPSPSPGGAPAGSRGGLVLEPLPESRRCRSASPSSVSVRS